MARVIASAIVILAIPLSVLAAEQSITLPADDPYATLKPGPGLDTTRKSCIPCHSTDYIVIQPRGDATLWQAVITKMIKVFGAPINEQDAKTIVDYLASAYGPSN